MRSASSDLYQLDEVQIQKIETRKERIKVRWWKDKEVEIRTSEFGPVISDISYFKAKKGKTLAMKWVGHQPSDEFTAFYEINRAKNWMEFRDAFQSYGVSGQNFLYADVEGHIGMVPAVKIPNRLLSKPGDFILNPGNPLHQWNGLLGTLELPFIFDPDQGFIVSTNNRPFVYNPPVGYFFSANDRIDRLTELFRRNKKVDLDFVKQTQLDVHVKSAAKLRDMLLEKLDSLHVIDSNDDKENGFFSTLRQWDGSYHSDSRGAVAFQMLVFHLTKIFYSQLYDGEVADLFLSSEQTNLFLQQDLSNRDSSFIKNSLQQAMPDAVKDYRKFKNWGDLHRLKLSHLLGRIPIIGARFRFGDYPAEGSYNSALKTAHDINNKRHNTFYGANSRFITMMRDRDENYFVLLGGQDGWVGSEHFADQVPLWLKGEYIQVPLKIENVRVCFPHQMKLYPAK